MRIDKAFVTNLTAVTLIAVSFFIADTTMHAILLYAGMFALSGSLTNQLAIYMLFEKVPFLYGSGVIEAKFENFKNSIRELIMSQFFTKEQLENFFAKEEQKIDLVPIVEQTDFTPAYEALTKSVMESNFGGMLAMFGGESALEGLKEPFVEKLKNAVVKIVASESFQKTLHTSLQNSSLSNDLVAKIDQIVTLRLEELTPKTVKEIIQNLIKEHLGWLVVWGGVFGGVIGAFSALFFNMPFL